MSKTARGVKGPLILSAALAVIAGAVTTVVSTGGGDQAARMDLGFTAAGIAFIASLVVCAMLMMTEKPNADHLGKGTGINRSSAKIPGGSGNLDKDGNPRPGQGKKNDDGAV
ncbi:hypothetical protein [Arthrobacter sp. H5]|uniref:hypothetical protein n=1 Tax=Arthrobacter sp. H5 TaxID=1267973 RepID=UPI0004B35248|nr:hypothetical protein [Arthrobacter sp. H5]